MHVRKTLTLLLLLALAACAPAQASTTPGSTAILSVPPATSGSATPAISSSTPQVVSPTPETTPSFTLEPTQTPTSLPLSTQVLPPMTLEVTDVPQPAAGSGAIQLFSPGPLSKLISPFSLYGYAVPGYHDQGTVVLYGEDGRVLDSETLQLYTAYTWAYFAWSLSFNVQGAGEFGRLTMSTQDEYGRLTSVYSVHLILLPEGNSIVNPPGDMKERSIIDQPEQGKRLSGGLLTVSGQIRPFNTLPLVVQLIGRDRKVIASQPVPVQPAADDRYVQFQLDLAYSISSGQYVLLAISQADDRISGMMYLYSKEIFLYP